MVDFALPDGLGWDRLNASAPPPPVERCIHPFGFAKADAATGAAAEQRRRQQLLRFWRGSGRFVQPSRPAPHGHMRDAQAPPCELAFGTPGGDPAGAAGACTITPPDEESPPSGGKACYMYMCMHMYMCMCMLHMCMHMSMSCGVRGRSRSRTLWRRCSTCGCAGPRGGRATG